MIPVVSVIIPNYNHADYLQQRIDSILQQSYQDFELIILDDKSTDNSIEIINRYKNHSQVTAIVCNDKNSGSAFKQWQKGISLASGEYIWIAESDDYASPDFLKTLLPAFNDGNIGLTYCQSVVVDENGITVCPVTDWLARIDVKRWHADFKNNGGRECAQYLVTQNTIPNASAVIFKRSVFESVYQPNDLKLTGDWLLWSMMLAKSDIAYFSAPLNYFRWHSQNVRSAYTDNLLELSECCAVIESIRQTTGADKDAVQTGYRVCTSRVLDRLLKVKSYTEYELRQLIDDAWQGKRAPADLAIAVDGFIKTAYHPNKGFSPLSKLKKLWRGKR